MNKRGGEKRAENQPAFPGLAYYLDGVPIGTLCKMKFKFSCRKAAASFDRFLCLPLRAAAHSEGKPCAKGCLLRVHAVGRKDEHILLQLRHTAAQSVDRAA